MFGYSKAELLSVVNAGNYRDWAGAGTSGSAVDVSCGLAFSYSDPHHFMQITDLKNAFLRGKTCVKYRICSNKRYSFGDLILNNGSLKELFDMLDALDADSFAGGMEIGAYLKADITLTVYRKELKGVRVFSPLHLQHVKPLKKAPKKWTVRTAIRAIISGQFSELACDGKYSDDYAYDDAVNFHRGEIMEHLQFAAKIVESPSGWSVWEDRESPGKVHICCHSFDSNHFVFQLAPAGETVEN